MPTTTRKVAKLTPSFDLIGESWRIYRQGFFGFIGMYLWGLAGLIPLAAVAILAAVLYAWTGWKDASFYVLFGVLGLAGLAWAIYYSVRAKIGWLILIRDGFKDVKGSFMKAKDYFWRYFWASLVVGLIVFALVFFLLVPAIIAGIYYAFALIVIIFEEKRTFSSIERSYDLVKGYWWPVFGRFLLVALIALLVSFFLNLPEPYITGWVHSAYVALINVFWALAGPFFLVYSYRLYNDVKEMR
ncbi:MAG: hypothetical protein ACM3PZ_02630 [Bacillota bacterium]